MARSWPGDPAAHQVGHTIRLPDKCRALQIYIYIYIRLLGFAAPITGIILSCFFSFEGREEVGVRTSIVYTYQQKHISEERLLHLFHALQMGCSVNLSTAHVEICSRMSATKEAECI